MPASHLILLYWASLALYAIASILSVTRYAGAGRRIGQAGMVLNGMSLFAISAAADRPPVYGPFEVFQAVSLIFALLHWFYSRSPKHETSSIPVWPVNVFLLLLVLLDSLRLNPDYCQYDNLFVLLFFDLRITSMGILLFAVYCFFSSLESRKPRPARETALYRGRNFLILGATLFLAGEYCGSYWCLNGWGDAWLWNHRFFLSAVMFLLSVMACHLPATWLKSGRRRALMGALPLVLLIVLFIHSQYH